MQACGMQTGGGMLAMHQQPGGMWGTVVAMVSAALAPLLASHLFGCLLACTFVELVFASDADYAQAQAALGYIRAHMCISVGRLMDDVDSIPLYWVLGRMWFAHVDYTAGQRRWSEKPIIKITVYWPRFLRRPKELAQVDEEDRVPPEGTEVLRVMSLMTSDNTAWERSVAEVRPGRCPPAAVEAANEMMAELRKTDTMSHVFYVNGPPDTGKSSSAKLLALQLDAYYVNTYDPRRYAHTLRKLLSDTGVPRVRLVIEISEADDKLLNLLRPRNRSRGGVRGAGELCDKGSVNDLLDYINLFERNVVLVMTGNTPFKHLAIKVSQRIGSCDAGSVTKPSRMHVINLGGDDDYSRNDLPLVTPVEDPTGPATKGPTTPVAVSSRGGDGASDAEEDASDAFDADY